MSLNASDNDLTATSCPTCRVPAVWTPRVTDLPILPNPNRYGHVTVSADADFRRRVAGLLREIEFVYLGDSTNCPACAKEGWHKPSCELAALLKETR